MRIQSVAMLAAVLVGPLSTAAAFEPQPGYQTGPDAQASLQQAQAQRKIPGQYIVVYKDEAVSRLAARSAGAAREAVSSLNAEFATQERAQIIAEWARAVNGMARAMSEKAAQRLVKDPRVLLVEEDSEITLDAVQSPATWGLDRVDQRTLPLSGDYRYDIDGSAATAYIIDTGIRTNHQEFGARATWGTNTTGDTFDCDCHCDGHGTHVAGTVGGATYGIAKNVALVAVKVLNCEGSGATSGVISGLGCNGWVRTSPSGKRVATAYRAQPC